METSKIRLNNSQFTNAELPNRNINAAFGENTTNERTSTCLQFNHLQNGNFDLKNEPRIKPGTKVNNDELQVMVEAVLYQTTKELA